MKSSSLIIGRKPVIEAIEAGRAIDRILFQKNITGDSIAQIRQLATERGIPIAVVPPEKLFSMTKSNHQGVIAIGALIQYFELQDVIDLVTSNKQHPLFVMLDGVTDVRNIGAIARTAVCCGAQAIILPDKGVGALNEDALKASAGGLEKIMVSRVNSLMKAVDTLHMNGILVFASALDATDRVMDIDFSVPCCIIMGAEGKGIFPPLLKIVDKKFKIPMAGTFDSLNVSVATGIILFEAMKQRLWKVN